jgi:GH24 family phage-related lysozyme (muramidase)
MPINYGLLQNLQGPRTLGQLGSSGGGDGGIGELLSGLGGLVGAYKQYAANSAKNQQPIDYQHTTEPQFYGDNSQPGGPQQPPQNITQYIPSQPRANKVSSFKDLSSPNLTTDLIKQFEGFSPKTYWDVNAHRLGYGTDTITRADGTIVPVRQGMTVTREDAERDLARRSQIFASTAAKQVGQDVWGRMPNNVQAALTSIAYNYGSLPSRIIPAVRTGNPAEIAKAVRGLGADNKGVNRIRRNKEADLILQTGPGPKMTLNEDGPIVPGFQPIPRTNSKGVPYGKPVKLALNGNGFGNDQLFDQTQQRIGETMNSGMPQIVPSDMQPYSTMPQINDAPDPVAGSQFANNERQGINWQLLQWLNNNNSQQA